MCLCIALPQEVRNNSESLQVQAKGHIIVLAVFVVAMVKRLSQVSQAFRTELTQKGEILFLKHGTQKVSSSLPSQLTFIADICVRSLW